MTRQLEQVAPRIPFEITTNDGNDLVTERTTITAEGRGWIDVHEVRLQGSDVSLDVNWVDQEQWQVELPVAHGINSLTLEAFNPRGELVGTDSITVTSTQSDRPLQDHLRISEIMYNPASGQLKQTTAISIKSSAR